MKLSKAHPTTRRLYRIFPLRKYGHPSLANRAGNMLQKAMIPFGVDGGTRSSAAERMMTYKTGTGSSFQLPTQNASGYTPLLISPKRKKETPTLRSFRFQSVGWWMSLTLTARKGKGNKWNPHAGFRATGDDETRGCGPGEDQHPRLGRRGASPCGLSSSDASSDEGSSRLRIRRKGMSPLRSRNSTASVCCKGETAPARRAIYANPSKRASGSQPESQPCRIEKPLKGGSCCYFCDIYNDITSISTSRRLFAISQDRQASLQHIHGHVYFVLLDIQRGYQAHRIFTRWQHEDPTFPCKLRNLAGVRLVVKSDPSEEPTATDLVLDKVREPQRQAP